MPDVFDFENTHRSLSLFPQGCGFWPEGSASSCLADLRSTFADALTAFDQAAGQEDHNQHEQETQRQVPALADERDDDDGDQQKSSIPSGRKANQPCSTLSLIFEKMFSKYLMKPAPRTGPISVPAPAKDGHQNNLARGGPLHTLGASQRVHRAIRPPARPAYMPEITNAASV